MAVRRAVGKEGNGASFHYPIDRVKTYHGGVLVRLPRVKSGRQT